MNNAKKILINCILISCLFSWYSCSSSNTCAIYAGDGGECDSDGLFSLEKWHKYPFEASREELDSFEKQDPGTYMNTKYNTRCIRESMICDLTQNVIPLGTPYEKVMSLLGSGQKRFKTVQDRLPSVATEKDYKYSYLYKESLSELFAKKKVLIYTSGGNGYGDFYLLVVFENEKVVDFVRTIPED